MKLSRKRAETLRYFIMRKRRGGLLWQGEKVRAETRQKVQAKGIVNHAAGGMAGSAVKKASGGASREQGETVRRKKHCGGCGKYESE